MVFTQRGIKLLKKLFLTANMLLALTPLLQANFTQKEIQRASFRHATIARAKEYFYNELSRKEWNIICSHYRDELRKEETQLLQDILSLTDCSVEEFPHLLLYTCFNIFSVETKSQDDPHVPLSIISGR